MEPEGKKRKYSYDDDSSQHFNHAPAQQGNMSEIRQRAQKYLLPLAPDQTLQLLLDICETIPAAFEIVEERAAQDPVHRKLFVRGLSWDTTDETLRNVFEQYGTIEEVAVVRDRNTNKSKGYGFVIYDDMDAANAALQQPVKDIDGRSTRCNLAALRDAPAGGGHAMMPPMMMPPMMPPMGGNMGAMGSNMGAMGGDMMSMVGATDIEAPEMRRLFIRGLDYNTDENTVRSVFERYGEIEDLAIATDKQTGRSKGFAFLTFRRQAAAAEALKTPSRDIDGRGVSVHLAALRQNQGGGRGGRGGGHMDGGMFPPYGGRGGGNMMGFMPPGGPGFFMPYGGGGGGRYGDY